MHSTPHLRPLRRAAVLLALPLAAACGGGDGGGGTGPTQNPVPSVTSVSPDLVTFGGGGAVVAVHGSGFVRGSVARLGGQDRPTDYVSAAELNVHLTAADVETPGSAALTVFSPAPGGGTSNAAQVTVANPVPDIFQIDPASVNTGSVDAPVRLLGSGFVTQSLVTLNGTAHAATYVSPLEMRLTLTAAEAASAAVMVVRVQNPTPGGGLSAPKSFEVRAPPPAISSLGYTFTLAGMPGLVMMVNGAGFAANSVVRASGVARPTRYISGSQLEVTLVQADLDSVGVIPLTVFTPAPGGGESFPLGFTVRAPIPGVASLSPGFVASRTPGAAVSVTGTGFILQSQVLLDGAARPTTWISSTEVQVALPAGDLATSGTHALSVRNPEPGGGTTANAPFEVRASVPAIAALGSTQVVAGQSSFSMRVDGIGFEPTSVVRVDGAARPTAYITPNQVFAALAAGDLDGPGAHQITVYTPGPGGGASGPAQFDVVYGVPHVTRLPSQGASAGRSGFTLTVSGSGFAAASVVRWNGSDRPTTFISSTQVSASITAGDVAAPGTAQVTVHNPAPGGGTSSALAMQVRTVGAATSDVTMLNIAANGVEWSAATGRIYASVPGSDAQYGNSIVAIDPATGTVTGSAFVGSEPDALAMSDDGQVLYVSLNGTRTVRRVAVATLTPGAEFAVGSPQLQLQVMPGAPNTVAVGRRDFADVCLYDSGVRRAGCGDGATTFALSDDGAEMYAYFSLTSDFMFHRYTAGSFGFASGPSSGSLLSGYYTRLAAAGGRIYASNGPVVDAERLVRVGTVGAGEMVTPDAVLGRIFMIESTGVITAYDMNNFSTLGSVSAGFYQFEHPTVAKVKLVRCGSGCLAYRDGSHTFVVHTSLAAP